MTFCIRDICQIQTATPAEVNKLNRLFESIQTAIIKGGVVNNNRKW